MESKIFVGCRLSYDMNQALEKNGEWQRDKLDKFAPQTIRFEGHDYIGLYLPKSTISLDIVKKSGDALTQTLESYVPGLQLPEITVFPQVFLG